MKKKLVKDKIIVVAGKTVDGREIPEKWIDDIVNTYWTDQRTARITAIHAGVESGFVAQNLLNMEVKGSSYGDVLSVRKDYVNGLPCVVADLSVNEGYCQFVESDQLAYYSAEIVENFCGTGCAYLYALTLTDTPACNWVSRAHFSSFMPNVTNVSQGLCANALNLYSVDDNQQKVFPMQQPAGNQPLNQFSNGMQQAPATKDFTPEITQMFQLMNQMAAAINTFDARIKQIENGTIKLIHKK